MRGVPVDGLVDVAGPQVGEHASARRGRAWRTFSRSTWTASGRRSSETLEGAGGPDRAELAVVADQDALAPAVSAAVEQPQEGRVVGHGRFVDDEHGRGVEGERSWSRRHSSDATVRALVRCGFAPSVRAACPDVAVPDHPIAGGLERRPGPRRAWWSCPRRPPDHQLHRPPGRGMMPITASLWPTVSGRPSYASLAQIAASTARVRDGGAPSCERRPLRWHVGDGGLDGDHARRRVGPLAGVGDADERYGLGVPEHPRRTARSTTAGSWPKRVGPTATMTSLRENTFSSASRPRGRAPRRPIASSRSSLGQRTVGPLAGGGDHGTSRMPVDAGARRLELGLPARHQVRDRRVALGAPGGAGRDLAGLVGVEPDLDHRGVDLGGPLREHAPRRQRASRRSASVPAAPTARHRVRSRSPARPPGGPRRPGRDVARVQEVPDSGRVGRLPARPARRASRPRWRSARDRAARDRQPATWRAGCGHTPGPASRCGPGPGPVGRRSGGSTSSRYPRVASVSASKMACMSSAQPITPRTATDLWADTTSSMPGRRVATSRVPVVGSRKPPGPKTVSYWASVTTPTRPNACGARSRPSPAASHP